MKNYITSYGSLGHISENHTHKIKKYRVFSGIFYQESFNIWTYLLKISACSRNQNEKELLITRFYSKFHDRVVIQIPGLHGNRGIRFRFQVNDL